MIIAISTLLFLTSLLIHAMDPVFEDSPIAPSQPPSKHPSPSYWLQTSSSPSSSNGVYGPDVPLEKEADVVIIGSGITGISAAYHLVHKLPPRYDGQSRKVVILEARDFCSGATGRNGGHCTAASVLQYDELAMHQDQLRRFLTSTDREEVYGNDRGTKTDEVVRKILTFEARTAAEILMIVRMAAMRARKAKMQNGSKSGAKIDADDDIELVAGSNWHLCQSKEEEESFDDAVERAKRAGLSDFSRQVRKVPHDEWIKRLHEPQNIAAVYEIPGATLHPRRLVKLLHRLAREASQKNSIDLKVHTWTPVNSITQDQKEEHHVNVISTSRGSVTAKHIVLATNAYTSHLLPQFAGPSGIVPTRAQCRAIKPTTSPSQHEPLWEMGFSLHQGYEYLQQRPASKSQPSDTPPCIFGGGRWASKKNGEFGIADDSTINADVSQALQAILPKLFPHNFDASITADVEWTGIMGWTRTEHPFVGPVVKNLSDEDSKRVIVPGQYMAAGYSGHGMTRAFSCAEVVVDMIVAQETADDWHPPVWFPLSYLTALPSKPQSSTDSRTSITTQYEMYAAGSNSGGQLGIGHLEDSHSWSQPQCQRFNGETIPFPPSNHRVDLMCGGANHTLAIVSGVNRKGSETLWVAGEVSTQVSYSLPSPLTVFHQLPPPSYLSAQANSQQWIPKLVAAAWESSYVVYATDDENQDDQIFSYGRENDFGQSGRGKDWRQDAQSMPLELPIPARGSSGRKSKVEITHLEASMRHAVLLATWLQWSESPSRLERRYALVGWGAARHGQLGDVQGSEPDTRPGPIRKNKAPSVVWTPRIIRTWYENEVNSAGQPPSASKAGFSLALGRDLTAAIIPQAWQLISDTGGTDATLLLLGSNKSGQLSISPSTTTVEGAQVKCTWNSTFILTKEGQLLRAGKNDHGQLGQGKSQNEHLRLQIDSVVCGSEHVLIQNADRVMGWGWNEHGNLAIEHADDGQEEDQWIPMQIWPSPNDHEDRERPVNIWAGCATTFLQVRKCV